MMYLVHAVDLISKKRFSYCVLRTGVPVRYRTYVILFLLITMHPAVHTYFFGRVLAGPVCSVGAAHQHNDAFSSIGLKLVLHHDIL